MVQWLRLHAPSAGGPSSIPGQETQAHMLQLRPGAAKKKKTLKNKIKFTQMLNSKPDSSTNWPLQLH